VIARFDALNRHLGSALRPELGACGTSGRRPRAGRRWRSPWTRPMPCWPTTTGRSRKADIFACVWNRHNGAGDGCRPGAIPG
jgi:hypothetical protein